MALRLPPATVCDALGICMTAVAVKEGSRRSRQRTDGGVKNNDLDPKRGRRGYESQKAQARGFLTGVVSKLPITTVDERRWSAARTVVISLVAAIDLELSNQPDSRLRNIAWFCHFSSSQQVL